MWNPFSTLTESENSDEESTAPLRQEIEKDVARTRNLTRYRVNVEFATDRKSETYYCEKYTESDNSLKLVEIHPTLDQTFRRSRRRKNIPMHYHPSVNLEEETETIISLANVEDVVISEWEELVAVAQGIPITVVETRDDSGDEWSEHYYRIDEDYDCSSHTVDIWNRTEWDAHQNN